MTAEEEILKLVRMIPKGRVTTYKIIAEKMGKKFYRFVGSVCKKNPNLISTPCHRVVLSNGKVGGYKLGKFEKIKLLRSEGIEIENDKIKNFDKVLFKF